MLLMISLVEFASSSSKNRLQDSKKHQQYKLKLFYQCFYEKKFRLFRLCKDKNSTRINFFSLIFFKLSGNCLHAKI